MPKRRLQEQTLKRLPPPFNKIRACFKWYIYNRVDPPVWPFEGIPKMTLHARIRQTLKESPSGDLGMKDVLSIPMMLAGF
jgi:hypothetical protein